MEILEVTKYSDKTLRSLNALLPQLSTSAKPLTKIDLRNIISNSSVHLLLARENRECFGTLTLVVFPIITGTRAWIEDVVVSESSRGRGVGKILSELFAQLHNGNKDVAETTIFNLRGQAGI